MTIGESGSLVGRYSEKIDMATPLLIAIPPGTARADNFYKMYYSLGLFRNRL